MGTPATSVLPAYIFILHFEPRLMTVLYGIPTPKEQLAVCSGNQLKAHSGSMLAQSKFGVLQSFLFASAEYALVVRLLSVEQVKDNACKLVGRCRDGLSFSKLACDATEELTEIVVGVVQRIGSQAQCQSDAVSDATTLCIEDLPTADLPLRT